MFKIKRNRLHENFFAYKNDWNKFARDILRVRLDNDQQQILEAVQHHRRVSVRSGNARGKDFVAATSAICYLYLNVPSKVIMTAPTERQAIKIMMSELTKIYRNAKIPLGGEILQNQIKFARPDWYLLAFKSSDYKVEAWTGFHSPNLMVIVTEASGVEQLIFESIESILTGDSKLLIVFNPNRTIGESYNSVKSPLYQKFKLSCLEAPNVRAGKIIIPGQVNREWVVERLLTWCTPIDPPINHEHAAQGDRSITQATADQYFKFEGQWYCPNDLFSVKVMGEFPQKSEDQLIQLAWIEAAIERWSEVEGYEVGGDLKLGVDVAGMGPDLTVLCYRYDNFATKFETIQQRDHMHIAGQIKNILSAREQSIALIDTIGEGAGVFSRLKELKMNVASVKFSEAAITVGFKPRDLTDFTGQRTFANMRAYCYWAIRDALDPQSHMNLALPPLDQLIQDLSEPRWSYKSDGKIIIEEKSEIKKRLGRSPDFGDALALSYYPQLPVLAWHSAIKPTTYQFSGLDFMAPLDRECQMRLEKWDWDMQNWNLAQSGILRGRSTIRSIK